MSTFRKARSPYFHFDFQFKGRRFHGSTGCATKRDADRYEAKLRSRIALGDQQRQPVTLDHAAEAFWIDRGQHDRAHKTTEYQLANLCAGIGAGRLLSEIGVEDFRRYVAKRRAQVSNSSVNRELEVARRLWKHALLGGTDVPLPGADKAIDWSELMLAKPKERVRELTEDEERRLFEKLPADLAVIAEFAILSGQRRSAVVGLRWDKVDLAGGRATITLKGGGEHVFPLTPRLVEIVRAQPRVGGVDVVFTYVCERPAPARHDRPRRLKGQRYAFSAQGWVRKWRQALADAGISNFRFHDLRHTRATRMLRMTGNLKTVQKLLGHTDIATTSRYAHALEDDVRAAMLAGESRTITEPPPPRTRETRRKLRKTDA